MSAPCKQQPRGHTSPLSLNWYTEASTLKPPLGPGQLWEAEPELDWSLSWSCSCILGLALSLGLGLWPADAETLKDVGTSTFPNAGKLVEFVALVLWDLGLYKGLDCLSMCTHGLSVVGLHLLQAPLVGLLGKVHVPQGFRVYSLQRFTSLWLGFLDAFAVPFSGLVVCDVVLRFGHTCTKARGSWSACELSGLELMEPPLFSI